MPKPGRNKKGGRTSSPGKGLSRLERMDEFFRRMVVFFEKDRTNILTMFLVLLTLTVTSSILESVIFEYPSTSLYLTANHVILKTTIFLVGCLILAHFASTSIRKVLNAALLGYWGILIPPLADKFIFGRFGLGQGYPYVRVEEFLRFSILLFDKQAMLDLASVGMVMQWLLIIGMSGMYVAVKRGIIPKIIELRRERSGAALRSFLGVFPRVLGVMLFVWLFIVAISTHLDLIIQYSGSQITVFTRPIDVPLSHYLFMDGVWVEPFGYELSAVRDAAYSALPIQLFLYGVAYHLLIFMAATAYSVWRYDRRLFGSFVRGINRYALFNFATITFVGIMAVQLVDSEFFYALDITFPFHWPYIVLSVLSMSFAWLFIDVNSRLHPSGPKVKPSGNVNPITKSPTHFDQVAIFFFILAVCTGFLLGWVTFLIILSFLFFGIIYTTPPIILRDRGFAPLFMAVGSLMAFLVGYLTPSIWILKVPFFTGTSQTGQYIFDFQRVASVYIYRLPPFSVTVFGICLVIFLLTFFLSIFILRKAGKVPE